MDYSGKHVLVTGGLGFIGSNLARRLVALGADVTIIDNLYPTFGGNPFNISDFDSKVSVKIGDVRDRDVIARLVKGKDFVFNLAGQTSHADSMTDPLTDLDVNVIAQLALLEAAHSGNPGVKIVFTSTRQLYGKPDYLPVDEKHPLRPVDVNGINKLAAEEYHLLYNNIHGIRSCILRLTNTYGPGMRVKDARQIFLGIWVRRLIEGKPIDVFGDGEQLRDFTYVDDCVEALLLAGSSERANGRIYNLGGDEVTSLNDLARMMTTTTGGEFRLVPFPPDRKMIDIGDYQGDYSRIRSELGWSPKVKLGEGLSRTVDYYRANRAHYWTDAA
jgi:UDP-glucose 4-epimerase